MADVEQEAARQRELSEANESKTREMEPTKGLQMEKQKRRTRPVG